MSSDKLGGLVTNKWLISVLIMLIMSMGGYIFRGNDQRADAQALQLGQIRDIVARHEVEIATIENTLVLNYAEIIRRLDRIERQP